MLTFRAQAISFVVSLGVSLAAHAVPGAADPAFGLDGTGYITLSLVDPQPIRIRATAQDPATRQILVVGDFYDPYFQARMIAFARLGETGVLDTSFGTSGWTVVAGLVTADCIPVGVSVDSLDGSIVAAADCGGSIGTAKLQFNGAPITSGIVIDPDTAGLSPRGVAAGRGYFVVTGGARDAAGTQPYDSFVLKYNAPGNRDASFGNGGLAIASFATGDDEANAVAVDSLDRIYVGGYAQPAGGNKDLLVARFTSGGALDTSFAQGGSRTVDYLGMGWDDIGTSIAMGDHVVFIGGRGGHFVGSTPAAHFVVWAVTDSGSPDSSFGFNGIQGLDISGTASADSMVTALTAFQHDVIAGGVTTRVSDGATTYAFAHFSSFAQPQLIATGPTAPSLDTLRGIVTTWTGTYVVIGARAGGAGDLLFVTRYLGGSPDTTFGTDGTRTSQAPAVGNTSFQDLAALTDGRIVVAGTNALGRVRLAAFNPDGSPDSNFGDGGRVTVTVMGQEASSDVAIAAAPGGKLYLLSMGGAYPNPQYPTVSRFNADGSKDLTWNGTGDAAVAAGNSIRSIATQADGKPVALFNGTVGGKIRLALARFNTDGTVDTSFGGSGVVVIDRPGIVGDEIPIAVKVQPDGGIVAGGVTSPGGFAGTMIAYRLTASGGLDPAWGNAGLVTTDFGDVAGLQDVAVGANGKVLLIGGCTTPQFQHSSCLAAFNANGTLDSGFANGGYFRAYSDPAATGQGDVGASWAMGMVNVTRLKPDGTIDAGYGFNGFNYFPGQIAGSAMQSDGKFVVAGEYYTMGNYRITVARYLGGASDTTPPETTASMVDPASSPTRQATATFTFSSSEAGSTFECRVDGSQFSWCSAPFQTSALAEGSHTFEVRAIDASQNADPTPAAVSWVIDTTPPDTGMAFLPGAPVVNSNSFTATLLISFPPVTYECRLDGGAWAACTSPVTRSGLADGSHTFEVRAIDAAGNVDPTPAAHTWTIDTVPPDTTITNGPSGLVASNAATFNYTSTESPAMFFECRLDGAAFAPCVFQSSFSGLAEGSHTFEVRAKDVAGNMDPTPASRTWTVDTVAPETTITSAPSGTVATTSATISFTSEAGAVFQCTLDNADWAACTSPVSFFVNTQGPHVFNVRAVDAAGNVDATPARAAWSVDISPPETTIDSGPVGSVASTSASFTYSANETGATFQCRLDGGAWASCNGSGPTYSGLAQGAHTFEVRATDAVGNVDPTPASRTWTVDTIAPDTTITGGPSGNNNPNTATFTFTSSEANSTFQCKLDTGAFAACSSGVTYNNLAKGDHTFTVFAMDQAGNSDPSPAVRTWRSK